MKPKKFFLMVIVLIVCLPIAYLLLTPKGIEVEVVEVSKEDVESLIITDGVIKSPKAELSFKTSGKIDFIINEGEKVSKDQILATLDTYDMYKRNYGNTEVLYSKGFASKNELDKAKELYEATYLASPFEGFIAKVFFEKGETVSPGTAVLLVVNQKQKWVEIQMSEYDVSYIKKGLNVEIVSDGYPDVVFNGRIHWISQEARLRSIADKVKPDETEKVFTVKVQLDREIKELKPGMTIDAKIKIPKKRNVKVVPTESICFLGENPYVIVVKNRYATFRPIQIGSKGDDFIEVISGIDIGEVIAISKIDLLKKILENVEKVKVEVVKR